MASVAQIWRHPIKGIGAEPLERATLAHGRPLSGDRAWAVLTGDNAEAPTGGWRSWQDLAVGVTALPLMAITARTRGTRLHLDHPQLDPIEIDPETDSARLIDWLRPLWPRERRPLNRLIRAPESGMTSTSYGSVSIMGLGSLAALSEASGQGLDPRRFRGNIWVRGLAPWEEFDWVGRKVRIGNALLEVTERIERCRSTQANPETGEEDLQVLQLLRRNFGHRDLGLRAKVLTGGEIATDAEVTLQ